MDPLPGDDQLIGRTIGHYRVLQHLGAGGMGEVYRARDERLHRDVAIKLLAPGILQDAGARRRFRSEALALSRINHPNVETIYDFETIENLDVLVLEHVPGAGLGDRLRSGPLPEGEVLQLGTQLANGLAALHDSGVVHRDLKPANVRVTPDGRLKILDLGIAILSPTALNSIETQSGFVLPEPRAGTPGYMAPEQVKGEPADPRTDIYGMGAMLYEMSTGRPPFVGTDLLALAGRILEGAPPAPRLVNPSLSVDLERIILKALHKERSQRYQSAREMLGDLERVSWSATQAPTGGGGVGPDVKTEGRPARRGGLRYVVAGLLVMAVAAGAWWAWSHRAPQGRPFAARNWALIADFQDLGGRTPLQQTLREALSVALQQSRYVNVLPRERVVSALRRMARSPDTTVDREVALDLGRRENVAVVLAGTAGASPGGTAVSVEAIAVSDRRTLFVESEELQEGRPLQPRIDALASRVRRNLGESLEQVAKSRPLADATTESLDALQHYSRGADQLGRGHLEEAKLSLLAALRLDPGFAAAHEALSRVYSGLGDPARERGHVEQAWALRGRLSDRERLTIEARYASLQGDYERGLESLQTLVGLYPDDAWARHGLGLALSYAGRKEAAVTQLRQALLIDPHFYRARATLVLILSEINRAPEALRVAEEARARSMTTPDLEWTRALALFIAGNIDEAREAMTALVQRGEEPYKLYGELYLDRLLIYSGQFEAARVSLADRIRADQQAGRGYPERLRRYLLGRIAALDGNAPEARRQARAILDARAAGGDLRVEHLHAAGLLAVLGGDLAAAGQALTRLRTLTKGAGGFARSCELHLEGESARARGRLPEAIESFRQSAAAYPNYLAHLSLAWIYDAGQQRAEATREWEAVVAARGDVLRNGFPADWVLAQSRLAQLYEAAGDRSRREAACAQVRAAWARGDSARVRRDALAACGAEGGVR